MKSFLPALQQLGRALMLPIAVLPVAAILLRLGQPDVWDWMPGGVGLAVHPLLPFVAGAGQAIFSSLGLLFAIGVAVGLARENHGAAGLAGVVCFLVAPKGAEALIQVPASDLAGFSGKAADLAAAAFRTNAIAKLSVPTGIISGLIAGWAYNRWSNIRLPEYLAFFGGRRFVPIAAGFLGLFLAAALGFGWPYLNGGMDGLSRAVLNAGPIGLFFYGVLNRILIVTGLHHVINNLAWFILGNFHGATGDLNRFFKGDPSAGAFMAGFFPVMMFGLPAACLAMYHTARPERRKAVAGLFVSMALTTFLTGVTEPIEFTFMFLAPALYAIHAVLTGVSFVIMNALGVKLGFGFSAGLFDYALNFNKATRPLLLIPVGLVYFAVYYGLFRLVITRFDLKTPGREPEGLAQAPAPATATAGERGLAFISALGGPGNLTLVDACTTRLRLQVVDQAAVDAEALKALGSRGMVRPSDTSLQVVLGPTADQTAQEIRDALRAMPEAVPVTVAATVAQASPPAAVIASPTDTSHAATILAGLGGAANVEALEAVSSRVRVAVRDDAAVDEAALAAVQVRGLARPGPGVVHLLIGPSADHLAQGLRALVALG
jgi:PTS system N-acetylglucosamine-specific IIC component